MRPVAIRRKAGGQDARPTHLQTAPPLGRPGFQPGLKGRMNSLEFINEFLNQDTSRLQKNDLARGPVEQFVCSSIDDPSGVARRLRPPLVFDAAPCLGGGEGSTDPRYTAIERGASGSWRGVRL